MLHKIVLFTLIVPAIFFLFAFSCQSTPTTGFHIRLNQVGYLPQDMKTAVVIAKSELINTDFLIRNDATEEILLEGEMERVDGEWGDFTFCYEFDFSSIRQPGKYTLICGENHSSSFEVSPVLYRGMSESLLTFFKVQRCGPTNPAYHEPCHLWDCTSVEWDNSVDLADVTGGWHDAGDYTKFHNTIAVSTYLLLLAYEFYPELYDMDLDDSGAPDILEEARIGLDWMLRAQYAPGKLINQVQNFQDHQVGWRMPENDTLRYNRPGYSSIGKNQIGVFSAVMAFASRIWRDRFYDDEYADLLLSAAVNLYGYRNSVPPLDETQTGMYQDTRWQGKMALGAVELFITTADKEYLNEAEDYALAAGSDYWWSWGDINSLAFYRLARIKPDYEKYLLNNLEAFEENRKLTLFGDGNAFTWGTTATLMGKSLQALLYSRLTNSADYNALILTGRDYVLGKNPWGISFINGYGTNYVKYIHHQVAHFNKNRLPGGIVAGPAPITVLENYSIERTNFEYDEFNSDSVLYYDDDQDYITNEPTIFTNATALFLFAHFEDN